MKCCEFTSEGQKMLCLSRRRNSAIHIGSTIVVKVLRVIGDTVELGISAPADVKILRAELEPLTWEQSNDSVGVKPTERRGGHPETPGRDNHAGQGRTNPQGKSQPHGRGAA